VKKTLVLTLFLAVLAGCGSDDNKTSPCDAACSKANALNCPNDEPSACVPSCNAVYSIVPGCEAQWDALVACYAAGSWQCDVNGMADPLAPCTAEDDALTACAGMASLPFGAR
jgi:hypothetical protein